MDLTTIFKALSNQSRLNILKWLEQPEKYFPRQQEHVPKDERFAGGVCVGDIQRKAGLSQSTISHYLSVLEQANLLESKRLGQWTYYRRNEKAVGKILDVIKQEL